VFFFFRVSGIAFAVNSAFYFTIGPAKQTSGHNITWDFSFQISFPKKPEKQLLEMKPEIKTGKIEEFGEVFKSDMTVIRIFLQDYR